MTAQPDQSDEAPLSAGVFSDWLTAMQAALRGERDAEVPCGDCTACCTASQFVHVGPDELDTLAHIPPALLFPAPGLVAGHKVMGYDERGHCPMLVDDQCSIYEHRPRTCRTYDCRIFAATGTEPDGTDPDAIAVQVRRWQFELPTTADRALRHAVHDAATLLRADDDARSSTAIELAVRVIETYDDLPGRDR